VTAAPRHPGARSTTSQRVVGGGGDILDGNQRRAAQRLADHPVQLPDVTKDERAQKRAQRGRRHHPERQHRLGRACSEQDLRHSRRGDDSGRAVQEPDGAVGLCQALGAAPTPVRTARRPRRCSPAGRCGAARSSAATRGRALRDLDVAAGRNDAPVDVVDEAHNGRRREQGPTRHSAHVATAGDPTESMSRFEIVGRCVSVPG
jgi:hypothetical protein